MSYCLENDIDFFGENDFLLNEPEEIEQRKVFTPYYKLWSKKLFEKKIVLERAENVNQTEVDFDIKKYLNELIP